jgi:hypothetical protein
MTDVIDRLRQAITTASNDDLSEPDTAKRQRHVERLAAMSEASDEIERLKAGIGSARSCLERCFEPTVPLRVLPSELERAVKDAYIALRRTLSN